jgi:hypothetical protein
MPEPTQTYDLWLEVLDELEHTLGIGTRNAVLAADGERFSTGVQWMAPEHLGQIPSQLEDRARTLISGQLELIREIEDARRSAGAHLAAVRSILSAQRAERSVYLDATG